MKRIVYLIGVAFALMLVLVSCNPDENDFSDIITVNQVSRTMLKKNLEYKHIEMPQQSQAKGD